MLNVSILGPLAAFGSSCTWAIAAVAYSRLSFKYPAHVINMTRAILSLPFFAIAFALDVGPAEALEALFIIPISSWSWFAVSMTASFGLGDVLFLISTRHLGVPRALTLASIYPLWATLVESFRKVQGGEALPLTIWIGVALIVSGVGLVTRTQSTNGDPVAIKNRFKLFIGILMALLTSLAWSMNNVAVEHLGSTHSFWLVAIGRMLAATMLCPFYGILFRKIFDPNAPKAWSGPWWLDGADFRTYVVLFIVEGFCGSLMFVYGVSNSPLSVGSALTSLSPVVSVGVLWALDRKAPAPLTLVGMILTLFGLLSLLVT